MSKKPVTTTQRQHIAVLAADNQSLNAMSRATGMHPSVCKRVAAEPQTTEMIETAHKLLAEQMTEMIGEILNSVTLADIEKASFRDRLVGLGILTDKAAGIYGLNKPAPLVAIQVNNAPEKFCLDGYLNR